MCVADIPQSEACEAERQRAAQQNIPTGIYEANNHSYTVVINDKGKLEQAFPSGLGFDLGPEADVSAGIAGAGAVAAAGPISRALRAASTRLGIRVAADIGLGMTRRGIESALSREAEGQILHAGEHLVEAGIIAGGKNAAISSASRQIMAEILSKPALSFIARIGRGEGETAVRMFVGEVRGQVIGVGIAEQATQAFAKGALVTVKVLK